MSSNLLPKLENNASAISFEGLIRSMQPLLASKKTFGLAKEQLQDFTPASSELLKYCQFSDTRYQRNLIFRSADFEILVLCWKPGQASPVHNHKGSWCGVKVLSGIATEILFQETPIGTWIPARREQVHAGNVTSSFDTDTHIIGNFHKQDLVSIHCYAPPLADYDIVPYGQTIAVAMHSSYSNIGPEIIINQL